MNNTIFVTLLAHPCWFILIGLIVSAYHGYRGFVNQYALVLWQRHQSGQGAWFWTPFNTVVVRYVYDALFYFFCSLVGFASAWGAIRLLAGLQCVYNIAAGTGAFLVFLILLGILGMAGQLPNVIHLGKLP